MQAYLDNSATTRVCRAAADAAYNAMVHTYGNPSSLHAAGFAADELLAQARDMLARRFKSDPREVYFTSGGTEGNNLAVFGSAARGGKKGKIVTTCVEHPSVYEPCKTLIEQGREVVFLPVDAYGRVEEEALAAAIDADTVLVSIMLVNNESGAIQPVQQAARRIRETGGKALLHCDAVQAFGKLPVIPKELGADLVTVSAHKVHGPKGVGALYVKKGLSLKPRTFGGGQEDGVRPGTENLPGIAGFAAAVQALPGMDEACAHAARLRDRLTDALRERDDILINSGEDALPYIINLSVPGIPSEPMRTFLSSMGVYVSSGSACAKGRRSRTLTAMGLAPRRIDSAIRVSFAHDTTEREVDLLIEGLLRASDTLRRKR